MTSTSGSSDTRNPVDKEEKKTRVNKNIHQENGKRIENVLTYTGAFGGTTAANINCSGKRPKF